MSVKKQTKRNSNESCRIFFLKKIRTTLDDFQELKLSPGFFNQRRVGFQLAFVSFPNESFVRKSDMPNCTLLESVFFFWNSTNWFFSSLETYFTPTRLQCCLRFARSRKIKSEKKKKSESASFAFSENRRKTFPFRFFRKLLLLFLAFWFLKQNQIRRLAENKWI